MPDQQVRILERRCAIYTRKSSEEGLEQDFNSLHAQREACEAYIKSQKHEGWRLIATPYDDGGYSGGSIERPALAQLMVDIQAKLIDVVVVYKVDRLTRSLTDFAKIVEVFDAQRVSFVSVTQQFNTTSSMGRLTLNVLLSFAQFEREVTGERIRDKIAASKQKGLWMGGFVPIGYRAKDRTLIIHDEEAETVRTLFRLYLQYGSVLKVTEELIRRGVRTRPYRSANNKSWGNRPFSRGHVYALLANPIYVGKIAHRGVQHDGQHAAIIDQKTWEATQSQLARNAHGHDVRIRANKPNLLAGLIVDAQGRTFVSSHTVKNGKRYRYYVASSDSQQPGQPQRRTSLRLPAHDIERLVIGELVRFFTHQGRIIEALAPFQLDATQLKDALTAATRFAADLASSTEHKRAILLTVVHAARIADSQLEIDVKLGALVADTDIPGIAEADQTQTLSVAMALRRDPRGETKIAIAGAEQLEPAHASGTLVSRIARGYLWFEEICSGQTARVQDIARREGVTDRYVSRLMEHALLPPAEVERILKGRGSRELWDDPPWR
ncbi:MAG: site-specific recombinase [Hyphomicrobiales bacterium]|nr:site-specific recombinase [Hyphomicrobiales bacterium]